MGVRGVPIAAPRDEEPGGRNTSRADVLEGGGSDDSAGLLDLLDEHPGVEGIAEVDVTGLAVDDAEGEFTTWE